MEWRHCIRLLLLKITGATLSLRLFTEEHASIHLSTKCHHNNPVQAMFFSISSNRPFGWCFCLRNHFSPGTFVERLLHTFYSNNVCRPLLSVLSGAPCLGCHRSYSLESRSVLLLKSGEKVLLPSKLSLILYFSNRVRVSNIQQMAVLFPSRLSQSRMSPNPARCLEEVPDTLPGCSG
jgi:hypothetical protein